MMTLPAWKDIEYIFIFGDSYSSTGYDVDGTHPTVDNPLGNPPYPGETYAGGPTWVGYLVTEHNHSPVVAHNFAVPGDLVGGAYFPGGVKTQIIREFLPHAGKKPAWAPWTSENSLFLIWVGVNDCGMGLNAIRQLSVLFALHGRLYAVGARNFVYFNVPPTDRSPAGNGSLSLRNRINEWNTALEARVAQKRTADVAIELYDVAELFNQVMDDPVNYGFKDAISAGDSDEYIWRDILHPTTAMHKVIAADFAKFLAMGEDKSQEKS